MCCFVLITGKLSAQVQFIENKGQWPAKAYYKADLVNGHVWLTDSGLLFSLWDAEAAEKMHNRSLNKFTLNRHAFYLHFKGGNFGKIEKQGNPSASYYNYFLGSDPSKWATGLHAWGELLVRDLYDGVDLRIFSYGGNLKYNLECRDKSKVKNIILQYIGTDGITVTPDKIEVQTSVQNFNEAIPAVYAESNGTQTPIAAKYAVHGSEIHFDLNTLGVNNSDRIIIDPILVFSTYSGSRADNFGCTGTYDELGNALAGGTVFSVGLPLSTGALQTTFGGGQEESLGYGDGRDGAILKFSSDGKQLLFATYLGGSNNEQPHSMVARANGDVYIMGSTRSTNFPVSSIAYDRTHNGNYDFFVTLLSADGTALLASTYIGGSGLDAVGADREIESIDNYPLLYNYADEFRGEIITDGQNIYVSGITYSTNFPRSNNSGWFGGKEDACLFSMPADLSSLNWSQIVGRNGYDAFYGVALGKHNDVYASGGSSSTDLPSGFSLFKNAYLGGLSDGIVVRFNKTTGAMKSARYVGTGNYEQAHFVQTDNSGNPYLYGQTEGAFPILNAAFNQPGTGQFIVRLDSSLNAVTMSTSFGANGNSPNLSPSAFLVDQCERIFVSGWGGETNDHLVDIHNGSVKSHRNIGNTRNLPLTADAHQKATDGSDFYVAVFAKNMQTLLYSTYFGGISNFSLDADEHVDGGTSRFDKKGIIYQAVCAGCQRNGLFPTTPGAYSRTNNSRNCNNAIFKIDFENLNKKPTMPDTFVEVIATGKISFSLVARDPDLLDPVFAKVRWVRKAGANGKDTPIYTVVNGIAKSTLSIVWNTTCNSWSTDTLELQIVLYDQGCPKSDTSYATIKILVTRPPIIQPPDAVCVSVDRNDDKKLKLSWPATDQKQNEPFFKYMLLVRKNPDATEIVLDTIRNFEPGEFVDNTVVDAANNNYCYFIDAFNTCDVKVAANKLFCTRQELNDPIQGVRLQYATVVNDKRVLVSWDTSAEQDFKNYEIYRYPRGSAPGKEAFLITDKTTLTDSSFDVDANSFCYVVVVTDKCGHVSDLSNEACNVVIRGGATGKPLYYFDLNWQDYIGWKRGVDYWELERQYNHYPWTIIENTSNTMLAATDNKLDFDWGGYWYRVTATEYAKGANYEPAKSQSNWIYLYQPPEVYVPSGITINGDNLNDVWGTVPVFVREYSMKVYNRWGQKVWESTDKYKQWDGFVRDVQTHDGVFAWHVTFVGWDDKTYHITGTVTLLH